MNIESNIVEISTQPAMVGLQYVMRLFSDWIDFYKPDYISKIVLSSLLNKYISGNKDALFGKFDQLIKSESYQLCAIFRDCFNFIGLNEEFKHWQSNA